jgi:sortase (surface protein transpeptidase)
VAKRVAVADPVRVQIPAIGVDTKLVRLGMKRNGHMEVPDPGNGGWYTKKPAVRPGEVGPAVIAAHVDSKNKPDVFYRLRELKAGDQVIVTDKKGQTHEFTYERRMQTPKDQLPAQQIFGSTPGPTLRLVTCAGSFDRGTGHYRENLTVFANAA